MVYDDGADLGSVRHGRDDDYDEGALLDGGRYGREGERRQRRRNGRAGATKRKSRWCDAGRSTSGDGRGHGRTLTIYEQHRQRHRGKEIRKYEDVVEVLADTVHEVQEGAWSAAGARAIASVCQVMLAAIEKQNKQNKPAEINGLAALKAISEGMSAGVAQEILMAEIFSPIG